MFTVADLLAWAVSIRPPGLEVGGTLRPAVADGLGGTKIYTTPCVRPIKMQVKVPAIRSAADCMFARKDKRPDEWYDAYGLGVSQRAAHQYSSANMMVMTRSVTDGSDGSGE